MKNFSFERDVIDVILRTIKKYQVYLTQPENLPQLAKLGYMYNYLWYAGRICYGFDGIIRTIGRNGSCEDNPKYKIEMCDPQTDEIENLIYDAWGMHVGEEAPSWEEFKAIVEGNKELSEYEVRSRKVNKTFDEWVDILTDKQYKYSRLYPNRRAVANHLLCTNGNGYGYKDGLVIEEASGADQDIDLYGLWEQAKFSDKIQSVVDKIMSIPEVKECLNASHDYIEKAKKEREQKDNILIDGKTMEQLHNETVERIKKMREEEPEKYKDLEKKCPWIKTYGTDEIEEEPYHPYYPISNYPYSLIAGFNEHTHPSYIQAGIEVCEDILAHEKEENAAKYGNGQNVKFAKQFLKKFKQNEKL